MMSILAVVILVAPYIATALLLLAAFADRGPRRRRWLGMAVVFMVGLVAMHVHQLSENARIRFPGHLEASDVVGAWYREDGDAIRFEDCGSYSHGSERGAWHLSDYRAGGIDVGDEEWHAFTYDDELRIVPVPRTSLDPDEWDYGFAYRRR